MDFKKQIYNWTQTVSQKIDIVRAAAAWIIILAAGMFAISQLQDYIVHSRESVLFSNTYLSEQPFGPRVSEITKPSKLWLNYNAFIPKDCNLTINTLVRFKYPNSDKYAVTPVGDPRVELHAYPTKPNEPRKISWLLRFENPDDFFVHKGRYEIFRSSRFNCGDKATDNLVGTQFAYFDVK